MKRTAMPRRTAPLRRLKRLNPVSRKRRRDMRERARVRTEVLERDGRCMARDVMPDVACGGPLDVHELVRRSQWAAGWLEASNAVVLCRAHHMWAHAFPEAARERGLLLKGHQR